MSSEKGKYDNLIYIVFGVFISFLIYVIVGMNLNSRGPIEPLIYTIPIVAVIFIIISIFNTGNTIITPRSLKNKNIYFDGEEFKELPQFREEIILVANDNRTKEEYQTKLTSIGVLIYLGDKDENNFYDFFSWEDFVSYTFEERKLLEVKPFEMNLILQTKSNNFNYVIEYKKENKNRIETILTNYGVMKKRY
jgi:hypothetical protein